ncbi:hypothetical protein TgHK011_007879 [Trichoderma gracile]|nr:hypothetical protein TgHK011_007879 [Trichoderma gracile]
MFFDSPSLTNSASSELVQPMGPRPPLIPPACRESSIVEQKIFDFCGWRVRVSFGRAIHGDRRSDPAISASMNLLDAVLWQIGP